MLSACGPLLRSGIVNGDPSIVETGDGDGIGVKRNGVGLDEDELLRVGGSESEDKDLNE